MLWSPDVPSNAGLIVSCLVQVAQAVLVPLLVDKDNVGPTGVKAIQSMMVMQPTPDFQVRLLAASLHPVSRHPLPFALFYLGISLRILCGCAAREWVCKCGGAEKESAAADSAAWPSAV